MCKVERVLKKSCTFEEHQSQITSQQIKNSHRLILFYTKKTIYSSRNMCSSFNVVYATPFNQKHSRNMFILRNLYSFCEGCERYNWSIYVSSILLLFEVNQSIVYFTTLPLGARSRQLIFDKVQTISKSPVTAWAVNACAYLSFIFIWCGNKRREFCHVNCGLFLSLFLFLKKKLAALQWNELNRGTRGFF